MIRNVWRALLLALVAAAPLASEAQQLVAEGQVPGMKIEIRELLRDDGGTVTLRFQLSNGSKTDLNLTQLAASPADWGPHGLTIPPVPTWVAISGVHLIDAANKKKYLVVRDSEKTCVCAVHSGGPLTGGQKLNLWAKFPAPPESVRKVTVIVPNFDPIEDVPITSKPAW